MSRVISFFAKDLQLNYAMSVSRSPKTGDVIATPEVVFNVHDELVVFRDHKHIFRLLKNIGCDFSYNEYASFFSGYHNLTYRDVLQSVLRNNPDSFIDYVTIRGDEDGIHNTVTDIPKYWSKKDKDRINIAPITDVLQKKGYAMSTYSLTGDMENKIKCRVACFSKDNSIIEVLINKYQTTIGHRYQSETGYTFMLNKPLTYDKHINKLDLFIGATEELWALSAEKSIGTYAKTIISANQQHPTGRLNFSDRNLLEQERMYQLINRVY